MKHAIQIKEMKKFAQTLKKMNQQLEKIRKKIFNEKGILKINARRKKNGR